VGLDVVARLRTGAPEARHRTRAARHLHAARLGDSLVLPAWRERDLPGSLGELRRSDSIGGTGRPGRRVLQAPDQQLKAAKAWAEWEAATSYLLVNEQNIAAWNADDFAIAVARIECHYFVNQGFFEREDQLLRGVRRIRNIPAVIVQGRYDVVCPMRSAWDLHKAWPEADFRVVPDAGHSALEAGNTHEIVSATDRFAR
jgi:proline iminopeptidase